MVILDHPEYRYYKAFKKVVNTLKSIFRSVTGKDADVELAKRMMENPPIHDEPHLRDEKNKKKES